jgi:N-acyl-D-aspartate/D-glutamate deacylase
VKALLIGGKASGTFVPLSGGRYCVRTVSYAQYEEYLLQVYVFRNRRLFVYVLKDFDEEKAERELLRKLSERRKDGKLSY